LLRVRNGRREIVPFQGFVGSPRLPRDFDPRSPTEVGAPGILLVRLFA
jgi:hypothetical protein